MRRIWWTLWNRARQWFDRLPPHVQVAPDLEWLSRLWESCFPEVPPIGHRIRGSERWVRFHSLPESKRYAENEREYDELLGRHHAVLGLLAQPGSELLVITASWSPTRFVRKRKRALADVVPHARLWKSILMDPDDEESWFIGLFVSESRNAPRSLDPLLRLVADFVTADVIITTPRLDWLYVPYDGGADVIAPDREVRDALAARFEDWRPTNSAGL